MSLPPKLREIRDHVFVEKLQQKHTSIITDPDAFSACGIDNEFTVSDFKDSFRIEIHHRTEAKSDVIDVDAEEEDKIEFDMIGVTPPFANAFRRIMIAEVPTMAIERVDIYQNTSIINDEVLAHRLGLIPINVDPRLFEYLPKSKKMNERNVLVFNLHVKCSRNPNLSNEDFTLASPAQKYINSVVKASDLNWVPQGNQKITFSSPIRPVHEDIVIARLRPGQEIEAVMFCHLGIGQEHAKWSPVSTASYRLMPHISLPTPVLDEEADALVGKCPQKVFDIEDISVKGHGRARAAKVARPRDCTMCRECIRESGWEDRVRLRRLKHHFLFSVESVGMYTAEELFSESVKVLKKKCLKLLEELNDEDDAVKMETDDFINS